MLLHVSSQLCHSQFGLTHTHQTLLHNVGNRAWLFHLLSKFLVYKWMKGQPLLLPLTIGASQDDHVIDIKVGDFDCKFTPQVCSRGASMMTAYSVQTILYPA